MATARECSTRASRPLLSSVTGVVGAGVAMWGGRSFVGLGDDGSEDGFRLEFWTLRCLPLLFDGGDGRFPC